MAKVKVCLWCNVTPMAIGLEGLPYAGRPGTILEMPEAAAKKLCALHAPGTFEILKEDEKPKGAGGGKRE